MRIAILSCVHTVCIVGGNIVHLKYMNQANRVTKKWNYDK